MLRVQNKKDAFRYSIDTLTGKELSLGDICRMLLRLICRSDPNAFSKTNCTEARSREVSLYLRM